ncbi:Fanconi anemia group C protein isoform X1 [Hemibagrus wyckioides]|uniref:Fanconi anemia group C protein isoform X1 n=1 Tax=Hemibagrus wyckioides TaxID=337641 RepID=UPI00266C38E0|nr:Fanconi anemia group C protein isoform X1 [Hemibagrus wyckioides]
MASLSELQMRFWMDKAVQWGQATSPSTQQDISEHMQSLETFLQQLVHTLQTMSSTTEAMKSFPFVGQFLGRLCWNPYVTADGASRRLLLQCMWLLYSAEPQNVVEHRANVWIRQDLLCHLTSEDEGSMVHALEKHAGFPPQQYYSGSLKKMVALLTTEVNINHIASAASLERCRFDSIHSLSVACIPLVTCPEVAPLIGALLKHYNLCGCSHLSEDFIKAVTKAWLSKKLVMEDEAVIALWCCSLSSLEQAVLLLLEHILSDPKVMHNLETVVTDSLLPKASALHCHIFLIVNDVFRNALISIEENLALRGLLQVFTSCFLQIRAAQRPQERLPLRSFFPHVPHNLLTPLLTAPADVPKHVWLEHLSWIGTLLEKFLSERNQEEDSRRGHRAVFETWFLLVQCGHWIDVAAKLLVSVGSEQSKPLLFLLTFYHHPTNRGHQNTQHNTVARQAWSDLRSLFLTHTLSPEQLSAVNELLCSLSANLVLCLLLNFAIFSQASTSRMTDVIQKVLTDAGVRRRAMCMLCTMHQRLKGDSALDARLTMLEDRLRTA